MTTYELTGEQGVTVPADRLMVQVEVPVRGWHVEVDVLPPEAGPAYPEPHDYGGQWLVQNPAVFGVQSAVIRLVNDAGPFGAGVECHTILDVGARGAGPAVRLSPIDVSGSRSTDLVRVVVDHAGGSPEMTFSLPAESGHLADPHLSTAGRHAVAEVRAQLATQFVDTNQALNIVVCVDGSASMLPAAERGDLEALVDTLHGVSHVLSQGKTFQVGLLRDTVHWLPIDPASEVSPGATTAQALLGAPAHIGSSLAPPALRRRVAHDNTMTYVVTDWVPGDAGAIADDGQVEGEARHLVLVTDAVGLDGTEALPGLTASVWRPGLTPQDVDFHTVISGLLGPCFDPASDYARRLLS